MFYRPKKNKKNLSGGGGGGGGAANHPSTPLYVRGSPNGTETNQLSIYKRGRSFSRVIQILIR